jgi:hypothetical protein
MTTRHEEAVSPRTLRWLAVVASVAASTTITLVTLGVGMGPLNVPTAIVFGALYLQPAVLMILPRRKASLNLAAGFIAAILGVGLLLIPYALVIPEMIAAALLSAISGILALGANSSSRFRGAALLAVLAVLLTAAAMFAPELEDLFRCRSGPVPLSCVTDEITYVGAAATVAGLWLACVVVWICARRMPRVSTDSPRGGAAAH